MMWVILWWLLTVGESVLDSDVCRYDDKTVKCGDECVYLRRRNCECGDTNLNYNDIFHDGKHCCTNQTYTGATQN